MPQDAAVYRALLLEETAKPRPLAEPPMQVDLLASHSDLAVLLVGATGQVDREDFTSTTTREARAVDDAHPRCPELLIETPHLVAVSTLAGGGS
jgi:hypothetical protein